MLGEIKVKYSELVYLPRYRGNVGKALNLTLKLYSNSCKLNII